jgi:hypothetical protein
MVFNRKFICVFLTVLCKRNTTLEKCARSRCVSDASTTRISHIWQVTVVSARPNSQRNPGHTIVDSFSALHFHLKFRTAYHMTQFESTVTGNLRTLEVCSIQYGLDLPHWISIYYAENTSGIQGLNSEPNFLL